MRIWRYSPYQVNDEPVPVCTYVTFIRAEPQRAELLVHLQAGLNHNVLSYSLCVSMRWNLFVTRSSSCTSAASIETATRRTSLTSNALVGVRVFRRLRQVTLIIVSGAHPTKFRFSCKAESVLRSLTCSEPRGITRRWASRCGRDGAPPRACCSATNARTRRTPQPAVALHEPFVVVVSDEQLRLRCVNPRARRSVHLVLRHSIDRPVVDGFPSVRAEQRDTCRDLIDRIADADIEQRPANVGSDACERLRPVRAIAGMRSATPG